VVQGGASVGSSPVDRERAKNVGCSFVDVKDGICEKVEEKEDPSLLVKKNEIQFRAAEAILQK
jgi:shikimate kinase